MRNARRRSSTVGVYNRMAVEAPRSLGTRYDRINLDIKFESLLKVVAEEGSGDDADP